MKTCTKCGVEKAVEEFGRRSKGAADGRTSWCRSCLREGQRRAPTSPRRRAVREERYRAVRAWLWGLKRKPCTDCGGVFHPVAMQFDHLPGTEKRFEVSLGAAQRAKADVLAELAKCELVCANCHAIRTWSRQQTEETPTP